MIATDLDGTLLRDDKTVSRHTVDIFKRCSRRGIKIVFATARPERTVINLAGGIDADAMVMHNGAFTRLSGGEVYTRSIPSTVAENILLEINRDFPGVRLSAEICDNIYANFNVSEIWSSTHGTITDFTDLPEYPVDKIIVEAHTHEDILAFSRYLPEQLYIQHCEGKLGLIMHKSATKLHAVSHLAQHFGIDMQNVAAFGDDLNDIGMLSGCGCGVAVENALDAVKAAAKYICGTNNADGVANWLADNIPHN